MLGANDALQNASAEGDTRTLSFHHLHTGEDITITFKRNGRYDDAALKKLDWFMRDWRKEKSTRMDPHLFDLLWEAYREVGATQPIDVVCGYRSPETNSMLRRRSSGVAQFSQHINVQAMDSSFLACRSRKFARSACGCSAAVWVSTRPPARLSSIWTPAQSGTGRG